MRLVLIAVVAAATAVAVEPAAAQKRQRDLIKHEEIITSPQKEADLWAAIRALRPQFLEPPKGTRSISGTFIHPLVVYFGNVRQPGVDALRNIMAYDAEEVRYLDPSQAENRFGILANGGAIVVKLNPRIPAKKDSVPPGS